MHLQSQPISDKVNEIEIYLQELELVILNYIGSQRFKWNDINDLKKKSKIIGFSEKVKGLIENIQEVRDNIRQLNREYLKWQLSINNLYGFTIDIKGKAEEIEKILLEDGFIKGDVHNSFIQNLSLPTEKEAISETAPESSIKEKEIVEESKDISLSLDNIESLEKPENPSAFIELKSSNEEHFHQV